MSLLSVKIIAAGLLDSLHPPTHQTGKDCHHHFLLHLHKVFWEGVDTRADLPRHWHGVSGKDRGVDSFVRTHFTHSLLHFWLCLTWRSPACRLRRGSPSSPGRSWCCWAGWRRSGPPPPHWYWSPCPENHTRTFMIGYTCLSGWFHWKKA